MSDRAKGALSPRLAFRIEVAIIGLGILALVMIFQPFRLWVFSVGCGLVVLAALANNLLPLAQPGRPLRGVLFGAAVVSLVFCAAIVASIAAAYLYGLAFLKPPAAATSLAPPAPPFWTNPLVWTLLGLTAAFAVLVRRLSGRS